jgi:hypothetical protein
MKISTIIVALCFALAPFAARAMVQHRDALHHAQRHTIPATATASAPAAKIDDDSNGLTRNRGCIDN